MKLSKYKVTLHLFISILFLIFIPITFSETIMEGCTGRIVTDTFYMVNWYDSPFRLGIMSTKSGCDYKQTNLKFYKCTYSDCNQIAYDISGKKPNWEYIQLDPGVYKIEYKYHINYGFAYQCEAGGYSGDTTLTG